MRLTLNKTVIARHTAILAFGAYLLAAAGCAQAPKAAETTADAPKNVIIRFADGAASTQWEFGRYSSMLVRVQPFASVSVVISSIP